MPDRIGDFLGLNNYYASDDAIGDFLNLNNDAAPYDVLSDTFDFILDLESNTIEDYWDDEKSYRCFFRRNKDTNQTNNNVSIYYPKEQDIHNGKLLKYRGRVFLALNQETIENPKYYRSDLIETNMTIVTENNGNLYVLPCYAYDLLNPNPTGSGVVSVLGGSIELMTQHCDISEGLGIGNTFVAMGGTWKIVNFKHAWNISNIYIMRDLDHPPDQEFAVSINAEDTYPAESEMQLTATATFGGKSINNATLQWKSSDSSVIAINPASGQAQFLREGNATITCIWEDGNVTDSKTIEVSAGASLICAITYTSSPVLKLGSPTKKPFNAAFYNKNGEQDTSIQGVWSFTYPDPNLATHIELFDETPQQIKLRVKSTATAFLGTTFTLNLIDTENKYEGTSQEIMIQNLY